MIHDMLDFAVDTAATLLGSYVFPLKVCGVLIFLTNIFAMNVGTYSSGKKPGCFVFRALHSRFIGSKFEALWSYGPTTKLFRSIHFCSSIILFAGALATRLWGFVILNFFGALFAAIPARMIRGVLPTVVDRGILKATGTNLGQFLFLFVTPIVVATFYLLSIPRSGAVWSQVIQLLGCYLLLIWYFSLFAGYWSKELLACPWVFFVACLLLSLGAYLSGPVGYPFVVLELGAALMEGFFLYQERQVTNAQIA